MEWSKRREEEKARQELRSAHGGPDTPLHGLGFHFEGTEKPLEDFEQSGKLIRFTFRRITLACCAENSWCETRMEMGKWVRKPVTLVQTKAVAEGVLKKGQVLDI